MSKRRYTTKSQDIASIRQMLRDALASSPDARRLNLLRDAVVSLRSSELTSLLGQVEARLLLGRNEVRAGEYLARYGECGSPNDDRLCGYSANAIDAARSQLGARGLALVTDDVGLRVVDALGVWLTAGCLS